MRRERRHQGREGSGKKEATSMPTYFSFFNDKLYKPIAIVTGYASATGYFHLAFSSSAGIGNLTTVPVLANAGNTTVASSDVFGASAAASLLQKQKDANGVPYFNIPANSFLVWDASGSVTSQMTSGATHTVTTFGEFY